MSRITRSFAANYAHLHDVRQFVVECAEDAKLTAQLRDNLILAVDEATTNIISHASTVAPHDIVCSCEYDRQQFVCELSYRTEEFSVPTEPPSIEEIEERVRSFKRGGLGVFLMHQLVQHVSYEREGDRNIIRLTQTVQ